MKSDILIVFHRTMRFFKYTFFITRLVNIFWYLLNVDLFSPSSLCKNEIRITYNVNHILSKIFRNIYNVLKYKAMH